MAALLLIQLAILLVSLALVPYRLVCAARSLLRTRSPREPAARDQKVFSEAQR
ncbi:MAG: hypothetical protein KC503_42320 [Myxococcales bacterium]|nr:hypothetical protein [Myxococcales bacterium]